MCADDKRIHGKTTSVIRCVIRCFSCIHDTADLFKPNRNLFVVFPMFLILWFFSWSFIYQYVLPSGCQIIIFKYVFALCLVSSINNYLCIGRLHVWSPKAILYIVNTETLFALDRKENFKSNNSLFKTEYLEINIKFIFLLQ